MKKQKGGQRDSKHEKSLLALKREGSKDCWWLLEAESTHPPPHPLLTASKERGLQSYNQKEPNSDKNLKELGSRFFPRASW